MNQKTLMILAGAAALYFIFVKPSTATATGNTQWQFPDGTIITTLPTTTAPYDSAHGGYAHPFVGPLQ